jgi:hypothetical protein
MYLISCALALPSGDPVLLADEYRYLGVGSLRTAEWASHWELVTGEKLPSHAVHRWGYLPPATLLAGDIEGMEPFDEDGYPTLCALEALKNWPWADPVGWLRLAQALWHGGGRAFSLSQTGQDWDACAATGGWSGNESVIAAMRENRMLWSTLWMSSTRGGRHVFLARGGAEDKTT